MPSSDKTLSLAIHHSLTKHLALLQLSLACFPLDLEHQTLLSATFVRVHGFMHHCAIPNHQEHIHLLHPTPCKPLKSRCFLPVLCCLRVLQYTIYMRSPLYGVSAALARVLRLLLLLFFGKRRQLYRRRRKQSKGV